MFKLSCADFSFPLLPHDSALKLISMLGFEGVDIGLFGGGAAQLAPDVVLGDVSKWSKDVASRVKNAGLQFADVFLIPGAFDLLAANHPDAGERQKSRDLFQRFLEFAANVGTPHMTALPGIPWKTEDRSASFARSSEQLAWRAEEAKKAKIIFAIEPHLESVAETPEQAIELVRSTPGLTLTLDYTHFTFQGMPDSRIEPLVAHASHFHARGACMQRLQMPVKQSTIDYKGVVAAMKRTNYSGYIGVEYCWDEWGKCNECDVVSETILMRDLLRSAAA